MARKRVCEADGGVMYCSSPRCPERMEFFASYVSSTDLAAVKAAKRVGKAQKRLRRQGFKADRVIGIDELARKVPRTSQVWSEDDMERLAKMLGDEHETQIVGRVVRVPLADIGSVRQSMIKFSALQWYIDNPEGKPYGEGVFNPDNLPVVIRNGDQLAVVDGTHRFMASYLTKRLYIDAVLADLI